MAKKDWEPRYEYKENKHYKEYLVLKENLKSYYSSDVLDADKNKKEYGTSEDRKQHKKYLKEILDLMLIPDGDFQKMVWDTISESEKSIQERRTRSRKGNSEYRI